MKLCNPFKPVSAEVINAKVLANAKTQLAIALAEQEYIESVIIQHRAAIARLNPPAEVPQAIRRNT